MTKKEITSYCVRDFTGHPLVSVNRILGEITIHLEGLSEEYIPMIVEILKEETKNEGN